MSGVDLADLYRERLTLRQVWVRLQAITPPSALHTALERAQEEAEAAAADRAIEDALTRYRR